MLSMFTSSVTTAGASFAVYSVIVGLDPERLRLSVIVALDPGLSRLWSRDLVSCFPRWFGKPYIGFLLRGIRGIMCGLW